MKNCVDLSVKEKVLQYLKRENYIQGNSDDSYYIKFEKKFDTGDKEIQKSVVIQIYQIRNNNFLIKLQVKLFRNMGYFKSQDTMAENLVGFQKIVYSVDDIKMFLEKFKILKFLRKYFDL